MLYDTTLCVGKVLHVGVICGMWIFGLKLEKSYTVHLCLHAKWISDIN